MWLCGSHWLCWLQLNNVIAVHYIATFYTWFSLCLVLESGLGERKGGQFGSLSAQAASYGSLEAPSRFYPPDGSWARAVSARAGKVRLVEGLMA